MRIDPAPGDAVDDPSSAALGGLRSAFAEAVEGPSTAGFRGGAALAVWRRGRPLLSLQAGEASEGRPWTAATPCLIWSASKGLAAACVLHALEQRGVPLESPVAAVWPEFAAAGKGRITIAEVLSHRAGLAAIDRSGLSISDHEAVAAALAGQPPLWAGDGSHGYGPRTFGFLADEIVRRTAGETLGSYWERVFRRPLGLDIWFGLPADRVDEAATVVRPRLPLEPGPFARAFADPASLTRRALSEPGGPLPGSLMNRAEMRAASIPSLGVIATADSLARFYSLLANGGSSLFSDRAMASMRTTLASGHDRVLAEPTSFSAGFMTNDHGVYGRGAGRFGHPGAGGSLAFADPDLGLGFAFIPGAMQPGALPGPRTRRLVAALDEAPAACWAAGAGRGGMV